MVARKPLQGVWNILSFNRHFYIYGLIVLAVIVVSWLMLSYPAALFWIVLAAFAYGFLMPLVVSAYVYDLSGFYDMEWLDEVASQYTVRSIVNINAGFDETSFLVERHFPGAEIRVFDFYDPAYHTEPAIKRARKVTQFYPGTESIGTGHIPLPDGHADLVLLLSAAHEIRDEQERTRFLEECRRICSPAGQLVVVEHLRDFPNFIAFTIGFTHFFSRRSWKRSLQRAGFSSIAERKFTPFMSVFDCRP